MTILLKMQKKNLKIVDVQTKYNLFPVLIICSSHISDAQIFESTTTNEDLSSALSFESQIGTRVIS